ncbi:MAG: arginase [Gemmatimonadetes bacterium]|nr:MAG: arginase [Gemmatimonadota bacterium]
MKIQFLLVPYDSGRREWRMGRGPSYLLRHGVGSSLRALGHEVDAEYVEPGGLDGPNPPASAEIATSFSLYRQVAVRARAARANGALPIVLGGNCGVTLGAIAAATMTGRGDLGVLWLDAHADFNTPETTVSGFLDGMGLAVLTGRCWRSLAMSIPGFAAMADANVVLGGARDLDPAEEMLLEASGVRVVRGSSIRTAGVAESLAPALESLRGHVSRLHFHLDADVLDENEGRANAFAAPGGLTSAELVEVARLAARRFDIVSAAVTAYDPAIDTTSALPAAIACALEALVSR